VDGWKTEKVGKKRKNREKKERKRWNPAIRTEWKGK
jgi:hypothetical protein